MDQSPLRRLPAELRALIFEQVLCNGEIDISNRNQHNQLLSTCHQIRREASPIFYSTNVFAYRFAPGLQLDRDAILRLIRQLMVLGPAALAGFKAMYIEWYLYSRDKQRLTIQRPDCLCLPLSDEEEERTRPVRHFRPGHIESEVVDAYRAMGLTLFAGRGVSSWYLQKPQTLPTEPRVKLDFWREIWAAETSTLVDDYWVRDSVRDGILMMCRAQSFAEQLLREDEENIITGKGRQRGVETLWCMQTLDSRQHPCAS